MARASSFAWVLGSTLVFLALSMFLVTGSASASQYDSEETKFLQLINEYRHDNGLGGLILSDTLTVASDHHSEDMAKYGFFAHNTVQSSYYPAGSEPWDRMAAEGYDYNTYRGENLAVGYETAEQAFQAWRNSPAHNAAMLDGNYRVIGISRLNASGSEWGWYWTTDFGSVVDPSAHPAGETPTPKEPTPSKTSVPEPEKQAVSKKPVDRPGVENGSFDNQAVWRQRGRQDAPLIRQSGRVRLGGYDKARDELRQKVRIPKDAKLGYEIRVQSREEPRNKDEMVVRFTDASGKKLALLRIYNSSNSGGWSKESVDLSRFAGKTVYLSFFATTDDSKPTTFLLDDVSITR